MNISQLLERNARKYYDKEAFVSGSVRQTYGEVDRIVNTLAHGFRNQGIDRMIVFCYIARIRWISFIVTLRSCD